MKTQLSGLLIFLNLLTACGWSQKDSVAYTSDHLKIIPLTDQTYVHVSYLQSEGGAKIPCNGLIYLNQGEAIVVDAPTDQEGSTELINWITNTQKHRLKAVVLNHFHYDCVGGLEIFHKAGIASYANKATLPLAKERGNTVPQNGFDTKLELTVGGEPVVNHFLGAAHTRDNVLSYIPSEKVLFGGCMVKSLNAGEGNLADAEVTEWSGTIEKIKSTYPEIEIVVPGHGPSGGTELLDYTIKMFEQ